jgi:hypothetical protein
LIITYTALLGLTFLRGNQCCTMLSSKGLKTTPILSKPRPNKPPLVAVLRAISRVSPRPVTNTLALRVSQPGLPSWWRLAAPRLNWVSTFVKHLSWALLVLNTTPVLVSADGRLKTDWVAPRDKLITLTRGPMARKKKSRVQFILPKRPLQLRFCAKARGALNLSQLTLGSKLRQVAMEEGFWLEVWPTPTTVVKSSLIVNASGLGFLIWR